MSEHASESSTPGEHASESSTPGEHASESSAPRGSTLLPTASTARTRRAVLVLLRPHRKVAAFALLALVAASALGLVTPLMLGRIVDAVVSRAGAGALVVPVVLLVVAAVATAPLSALGAALVAQVGEPALARLREQVLDRALRLPGARLERAGSGDLLARTSGDVGVAAAAIRQVLPLMAAAALSIIVTLVGLAALGWRFAVAGLCAVPVQAWTLRWYLRTSGPVYGAERIAEGGRAQQLLDAIGGASTIRALRRGAAHTGLVEARSREAVDCSLRATALQTRFYGRLNLAEFIGLGAILLTGFFLVRADIASIGAATAAALFFARLFDPINIVLGLVDDAQAAAAGLARLVGVAEMDVEPEPRLPSPPDASAHLAAVHFGYEPGHDVLHGVDLTLPAGRRTALVGASGAGKSTLAALLAGVHRPAAGGVHLGSEPAPREPAELRPHVALVTQEVHVFAGPLRDDLHLAAPAATDAELLAVLDRVGASGWLGALPDGLDTVVGAGGHRLDAAAAQQLALARVLLADPPVVVLDEATADAGSAGAAVLDAAADAVLEGRTGLVVAHRLSQAARADRIVVLDGGRVAETGTHEELLASGGRYAALWAATDRHANAPRPV